MVGADSPDKLDGMVDEISAAAEWNSGEVSIGDVLDKIGQRSFGPMLPIPDLPLGLGARSGALRTHSRSNALSMSWPVLGAAIQCNCVASSCTAKPPGTSTHGTFGFQACHNDPRAFRRRVAEEIR
jgi:hypothetical protein